MINVGCDAWDCRPVDEATLAALIEAGPGDLPPLPTHSVRRPSSAAALECSEEK